VTAYDLLVIGGGVNGTGIARDAAMRGLSTMLVEKKDFAAGSSGANSGMIHGGIRYLMNDPQVTDSPARTAATSSGSPRICCSAFRSCSPFRRETPASRRFRTALSSTEPSATSGVRQVPAAEERQTAHPPHRRGLHELEPGIVPGRSAR
jgi:glycerol-3-phosphate dehydrogenase